MKTLVAGLLRNRVLWTAATLSAAYWVIAPRFPVAVVLEWLNGILCIIGIAVFFAYAPAIINRMAQTNKIDRVLQLSMGIALAWGGTSILRFWGLAWRKTGMPDWMQLNYLIGYISFLIICAGVLHITAPGAVDGVVPKRNWIVVGIAIAFGVGLAVSSSNINFVGMINFLDDYIRIDINYFHFEMSQTERTG